MAVATAKTLAYALDIDLVGVSSLQALTNLSVDGVVIPIMDARRNNVYVGFYENGQAIVLIVMLLLQMFLSKLKLLKR